MRALLAHSQDATPPLGGEGITEGFASADAARAAAGDRRAFERLYRENVDRVFSICARMVGDRSLAEELTQDVFVRAWEKLHLFRGESAFTTWLHRLAVNVVLNRRKSDGVRRSRFGSAGGGGEDRDDGPDPIEALPGRGPDGDRDRSHSCARHRRTRGDRCRPAAG